MTQTATVKIPKRIQRVATFNEVERMVDEEKREITFTLSSEKPIEDWPGEYLVLDHSDGAVIMDRIQNAAPLLFNHDRDKHLGKIMSAGLSDGKLNVTAKFGNSELAREKFQDVKDGILSEVSVSAKIHDVKLDESMSDGGDTYRATKWEPLEASLVTVPADISVGIGRAESTEADDFITIERNIMSQETKKPKVEEKVEREEPRITFKTDPKDIERAQKTERERVSNINDLARKYNVEDEIVRDYVDNDKSLQEFQHFLLTERGNAKPVERGNSELGLSDKEKEQYSIVRAIRMQAEGKFEGLEAECSREMAKKLNREAKGFFIPTDIATHKRDLSTIATKGGYTVGTDVLGSSLVELLRNKTMLNALGVRNMTGLRGNVAIPKVEGGATAYWLSETEEVSSSDQDFGQIGLTPHRLVGDTAFSKQLLAQSSISVESFVRDDLMRVLAIELDRAGINGSGTDGEPLGILNTTGINTVTFSAAATFGKMIDFETEVATDNADVANMAYLTTPAVRGKLKQKSVDTGSGIFVWSNGQVNGYRAEATNQVPSNKVIFGNWADAMYAIWDGMDVVVDPYSLKKKGQIEITITQLVDFAVRHAVSFAASTDSGAQ